MEPDLDVGNILEQVLFDIAASDSAAELNLRCAELALGAFERLLDQLCSGKPLQSRPQDLSQRLYFGESSRTHSTRARGVSDSCYLPTHCISWALPVSFT